MKYATNAKSKSMTLMLTREQYAWLKNLANKRDCSAGRIIRAALEEYRDRNAESGSKERKIA